MGDLGQMGQSETELVEQLSAVGIKLASPPTDPHELLLLLNQTECFLSQVKQAPSESVFIALHPTIKAVVAENLLNQSDMDLKIVIASCLAEITRITAPNAPYDNGLMKEVFQLIVDAFENLNDISSPSYSKCVTILETVARSRLCVLLLDLEYDALVLEMFRHFLRTIRPSHAENVVSSMEAIMTHVLEESDDSELLSAFLSNLKLDQMDMSPMAHHLVEKVINNCKELVQSTGISLSDYGCIVTSPCQENSDLLGQTQVEMKRREIELVKQLLDVGSKLASPPTDPRELFSLLNQTKSFLAKVEQAPSESVFTALHPATKALVAENLLNQTDMDLKFAVASCLAEIIRITVPNAPYDDELMKEVFRLIVDAIRKLDEISSPSYSRRVEILEIVARTRLCLVLLDLECESFVLDMFRHFFRTLRPCHTGNVIFWMEDIMTHVIEESDDISSELLSCLLSSAKKDDKDVLPVARELVKRVMTNCASKLKPYLNEVIQSAGTSLSDYDSVVASLCDENSNALGSDSLERDVTWPEEIGNAEEELPRIVTRSLVPKINSNSMLVSAFPEQEPEHSPQNFQPQSASIACRVDDDIPSCSTGVTLESLADHSTKSTRGRKNKSSILVDTDMNSQCAGDKEALAVHTQRIGKTMEIDGLQSDCPSGKQAEISTCSKPDKTTEIQSSSKLDIGNAHLSSSAPVDNLPDISHPKQEHNSVFTAKQDITVVADQPSSISVHKETSENRRTTEEFLSHLSSQSKVSKKGTGTMKENKNSSDSRRKPLPSSRQKELKEAIHSGKSPIKRIPSGMETDHGSVSTPLDLTSEKRSTRKRSSNKRQNRKAIAETDVFAGTSSKVCTEQIDEKECNQNLVGSRIEVWWPMDEKFYSGVVSEYYSDTEKHKIIYDDNDTETLMLKEERWKLVDVNGKNTQKPNVSSKRNDVVADLESDGVLGSSKERIEATTTQPKTSVLGEESAPDAHHRWRGVSGLEESAVNIRKRPVVECENKSSAPKTAEGRSNRTKRSATSERTSLAPADKTSSAIKRRATGRKSSSNCAAVQEQVSSPKRTVVQSEEIEDLSAIEAERRLQRGKRRRLDPVIADDVPTPLTPQAPVSDDPHVEHIFTPTFMGRMRVFSLICRNKWYERNLEPLPDYAEFADEFGRDAAFDHGNLFKTIRQSPHYRGLDTSDTGLLLDLWYKLPLLIEALHKSVSSQIFLEKNRETINGWFAELTQAGFNISVPLAAFELLTIWPTNFVNFRESLDSVSRQLNEERQNVEALKSKLERVAGLDSRIEDLKQQIRELESERTSLVPLTSVELELEKYGTSMKAYRLQKLKELHEKELEEAKQFLEEVALGGWYERIRLAPLPE